MRQFKHTQHTAAVDRKIERPDRASTLHISRRFTLIDTLYLVLPLVAFVLWSISLQHEDVRHMSNLGMVSTFPPLLIVALGIMVVSFCVSLQRPRLGEPLLLLHLLLLIFMLYGIQNIVEEAPRFSVVYRHAGYIEYIMRTGSIDPKLDTYFSWPGFFITSALVNQLAGYHDILSYAGWAPVFYNVIYIGPLYMIFASATTDKRLIWLGLSTFYLTNWIGQDYFSPQGFNFFLYLTILAILLKWFKTPAKNTASRQLMRRISNISALTQKLYNWTIIQEVSQKPTSLFQKVALILMLLTMFSFVVFSHPLTPFFVIASVTTLALFNRCYPRLLPLIMAMMTAAWIIFMTGAFLAGHANLVVGNVGQVSGAVSTNITSRVQGDAAHIFIATTRVVMTGVVWVLALLGAIRRIWQRHADLTYMLLALAPFPLFAAQQYGGEMSLRIYLFSLPFMCFFAAALFYPTRKSLPRVQATVLRIALIVTTLFLLAGFLFTRYGNERMDYVTYNEYNGIHYLYTIAPPQAMFLAGWNDTPWLFDNYEKYHMYSLADSAPDTVRTQNVTGIVQFIKSQHLPRAYVIITRGQEAQAEGLAGLSPSILDRLSTALTQSGNFEMVYQNPDVKIYVFVDKPNRGKKQ